MSHKLEMEDLLAGSCSWQDTVRILHSRVMALAGLVVSAGVCSEDELSAAFARALSAVDGNDAEIKQRKEALRQEAVKTSVANAYSTLSLLAARYGDSTVDVVGYAGDSEDQHFDFAFRIVTDVPQSQLQAISDEAVKAASSILRNELGQHAEESSLNSYVYSKDTAALQFSSVAFAALLDAAQTVPSYHAAGDSIKQAGTDDVAEDKAS